MKGHSEKNKTCRKHAHIDMTGAKYLLYLRNEQGKMKEEILALCMKNKRKEGVTADEIYANLKKKYPMQESKKEDNTILQGILRNLLLTMVSHGKLEETLLEEGVGYRIILPPDEKKEVA